MRQAILKLPPAAAIACVLAAATSFASGVDPALLALAPPDTKILVGIQVSQAQASPIGQYFMSNLHLDQSTTQILTEAGFDPRRDLREVLAVTGDGSSALLLGGGTFQPAKVAKAAVAAGAASSAYRGVTLLTANAASIGAGKNIPSGSVQNGSIAFLDASTVMAGDTDAVKAAIDRHTAHAVFSGPLAERARQISVVNDAWLAALTPPAAFTGGAGANKGDAVPNSPLGPLQPLLQAAQQFSAGVKFAAAQVTLSAEVVTRSPQDAQSMADLLRFLVSMMQSNNGGGNTSKPPALAAAPQISSSGSAMHVILSIPEQQMEELLLPAEGRPKKAGVR